MNKLQLPQITLVIADCKNYGAAVASLKKSMEQVDFGAVKFFTDINIKVEGVETVIIKPIKSTKDYSWWIMRELYKHITTEFILVTQHDSWVLDAGAWEKEFLNYSYIGAAWLYVDGRNVGNGGFSLRTLELMTITATDDMLSIYHHEDDAICRIYRPYLEQEYAITFAPEEMADKFSYELRTPIQSTFGFHSNFHDKYKKTVLIKRMAALGDVIAVEPVLRHFHEQGWRVILETLPQFELLYKEHYFPILFPSDLDPRIIPDKTYNLDMSYESTPKQLHLQSYYDFCEITNSKICNPQLNIGFGIDSNTKMISKYVVLHDNKRGQNGRNIDGVDWDKVVLYFNRLGYVVLQIGRGENNQITGAIPFMTINEQHLMYVCAGADFMIGGDSGIAAISVAFNVPSIIFFGSVNPEYIHPDLSNVCVIDNGADCPLPKCWHSKISTVGVECVVDETKPPCVQFNHDDVMTKIDNFVKYVTINSRR